MNKTEYLSKPKISFPDELTWKETQHDFRDKKGDVEPVFLDHIGLTKNDQSIKDNTKLIEELREISKRRTPETKKHNDSLDAHLISFSYIAFKQ